MTIITIVTLLALYESAWIGGWIAPLLIWSESTFSQDLLYEIEVYTTIPVVILDVSITVSMTYHFISRLLMVMVNQAVHVHDGYQRMDLLPKSLSAGGRNRRLISFSVRLAVLSITSLLSTFIFITFNALSYFYNFYGPMDKICVLWYRIYFIHIPWKFMKFFVISF